MSHRRPMDLLREVGLTPGEQQPEEQMEAGLDSLRGSERRVLQLRFGLEDRGSRPPVGLTLEEVGEEFNVTPRRIRQIEAKALRKLRTWARTVEGLGDEPKDEAP